MQGPTLMSAAMPASEPTVLVVEDEALVALLVADILAEGGYRSVWSPDGRVTPERTAEASAAVVDLRLADGQDGRESLRDLRERRPALPVVVVTGFHPEDPQADLRGLGGPTLRLAKPFAGDDFLDGLSAVLGARGAGAPVPRRRASDALLEPEQCGNLADGAGAGGA
jgi:DNA-binding response OmpR family regulator